MYELTYILLITSMWCESKKRLSVNISSSIKKHTKFQEHWRFKNKESTQTEKKTTPIAILNGAKSKLQRKLLVLYSVTSVFIQVEGLSCCHGARYTYKIKTNRGGKPPANKLKQISIHILTHKGRERQECDYHLYTDKNIISLPMQLTIRVL